MSCSEKINNMDTEWIILAASLLLLLLPGSLLHPWAARKRLSDLHSSDFRLEQMLSTWQHWLDLPRSFLATFLLVNSAILNPAGMEDAWLTLVVVGLILALAIAAQTVHYLKGFYFTAPIFFIWGITFALVDPIAAGFGIVFSTIFARLINHVDLKLPLMAGLTGAVGYLLNGFGLELALACALIPLPLILAYVFMDTLLCYSNDLATE